MGITSIVDLRTLSMLVRCRWLRVVSFGRLCGHSHIRSRWNCCWRHWLPIANSSGEGRQKHASFQGSQWIFHRRAQAYNHWITGTMSIGCSERCGIWYCSYHLIIYIISQPWSGPRPSWTSLTHGNPITLSFHSRASLAPLMSPHHNCHCYQSSLGQPGSITRCVTGTVHFTSVGDEYLK